MIDWQKPETHASERLAAANGLHQPVALLDVCEPPDVRTADGPFTADIAAAA